MKNLEQGINLLRRKHLRERRESLWCVPGHKLETQKKREGGIEEKEARASERAAASRTRKKGRKEEGKRKPTLLTSATLPFRARKTKP
jgi:hypothetical protein